MSDGQHPTAEEFHAYSQRIANGNAEARIFLDLWYRYCHRIDDVLDSREDGRPTMTSEDILETFILAALLYNCAFFVQHRAMLFPTVLTVTNQYCDSVAWERSPKKHRRTIADVMRICGDEMLFMVAMITGGWSLMRKVSPEIRDLDYIKQHDADGNPI